MYEAYWHLGLEADWPLQPPVNYVYFSLSSLILGIVRLHSYCLWQLFTAGIQTLKFSGDINFCPALAFS